MSKKIVFMGTASFSLKVLQMLLENKYDVVGVVTQPDRYVGRKKVLTMSDVKQEALKHDIPVLQPERIRNDYQAVLDLNPDLIITAAYGQIVPTAVLEAPRRKFDSCLQFFTNQISQNVDCINASEFFYCQIRENKCTNIG